MVLAPFEGKPADARIVTIEPPNVEIEWVGFEDDPTYWFNMNKIKPKVKETSP